MLLLKVLADNVSHVDERAHELLLRMVRHGPLRLVSCADGCVLGSIRTSRVPTARAAEAVGDEFTPALGAWRWRRLDVPGQCVRLRSGM